MDGALVLWLDFDSDQLIFVWTRLSVVPGARFSKVPRTFRARKAIRKTATCLFCKAGLFICCRGNKNKYNCKVSCLKTPSFWRYKENYVTRFTPEKFRDFRETGPWLEKDCLCSDRKTGFCWNCLLSSWKLLSLRLYWSSRSDKTLEAS